MADKTVSNKVDTSSWHTTGRNVKMLLQDGVLFIAVATGPDAYKNIVPTAKGNVTIASTLGNQPVPGSSLKLGLNIYGPPSV